MNNSADASQKPLSALKVNIPLEPYETAVLPSLNINSDDLETLHAQEQEGLNLDTQKDEQNLRLHHVLDVQNVISTDTLSSPVSSSSIPDIEEDLPGLSSQSGSINMTLTSSPVLYPPSSSPPLAFTKKRKLFQTLSAEPVLKKNKIIGGFLEEEEEEVTQQSTIGTSDKRNDSISQTQPIIDEEHNVRGIIVTNSPKDGDRESERSKSPSLPPLGRPLFRKLPSKVIDLHTNSGNTLQIPYRNKAEIVSYEQTIAQRSVTAAGRAKKSYYGVDIHKLMDDAKIQIQLNEAQAEYEKQSNPMKSVEVVQPQELGSTKRSNLHQMWTEKYRAKKFTELVGDERTHRLVLRWLKAWDEVVFPGNAKPKARKLYEDKDGDQERRHRKILLLTGPPGLGKTTLAHVCAKQAGYEVLEINASDDRSRDVVKGRIKDALGTETVRGVKEAGKARRAGKPVCVVVDEVDGVVTGSGASGGEGGFIKALIDLVQLDERNSSAANTEHKKPANGRQKGDKFRLLRPLILICNDVYAPSLRPLRTSSIAEIVHVRKPPLDKVIIRMKTVFEKENIHCDNDAVRKLCESSWGLGARKQNGLGNRGAGEGDIRGVLVQGEWMAHKIRAENNTGITARLTKKWIESHLGQSSGSSHKGLGRGGTREVVERIFIEGAGVANLPTTLSADDARMVAESKTNPIGVADLRKRAAINALREMVDTCGDHDRLMTDCFATYPTQVYQDDVILSKPNACYEWLHFHDSLSSRIFSGQEWELNPYLNTGACGFHHLFAAVDRGSSNWNDEKNDEKGEDVHPFSGLKADFAAYEAEKRNKTVLTELQGSFSAPLLRMFSSVDTMATELMPSVNRIFAPEVKPVIVGGSGGSATVASVRKESERNCIQNSVRVMSALNVAFEKVKIELESGGAHSHGGFAYRMEPPLDTLTDFHLDRTGVSAPAPVRYAVRQVLDQEYRKEKILQNSLTRNARSSMFDDVRDLYSKPSGDGNKENVHPHDGKDDVPLGVPLNVKRDFFGRIIKDIRPPSAGKSSNASRLEASSKTSNGRVWVSFHEGFSNAVRKPITLKELMDSF